MKAYLVICGVVLAVALGAIYVVNAPDVAIHSALDGAYTVAHTNRTGAQYPLSTNSSPVYAAFEWLACMANSNTLCK